MSNKSKEEKEIIEKINQMNHYEMGSLWRYAPAGHPYFDKRLPYHEIFKKRLFEHFGGFNSTISKMSEYIPYQKEWEKEILKLSKIQIVELMRNVCMERDKLEQENQRLKDVLEEIIIYASENTHEGIMKALEIAQKARE